MAQAPTPLRRAHRYAAFISYSREADKRLAPALQSGLQRFAKPWYRVRAVRVFRDDANLSANPDLWGSICKALDDSEFFILLASEKAAHSEWVGKEAEYWLEHHRADDELNVIITLTDGELLWAGTEVGWAHAETLPPALRTAFAKEPRYVNVRWARTVKKLGRRDARLRDALADLAGTLHRRPKDELFGEDVRQHRRALRLVWAAVTLLALLAAFATFEAVDARQARDDAQRQRKKAEVARDTALASQSKALAGQAVASLDTDPRAGLELALQATGVSPTPEADAALRAALSADLLRSTLKRREHAINSAEVDAQSKRLVTTADDGKVVVSSVPGGKPLHDLELETAVNDAVFQPKGSLVAIASDDGVVRLWNTNEVRPEALKETPAEKPSDQPRAVASVAFNRDGTLLVSTSNDGRARLWNVARRALLWKLGRKGGEPVTHATFSPDGHRVLTAGVNGMARIWRVSDAELLQTLHHGAVIDDAEFSPNGRLVVTAGADGTAKIWGADEKQPLQTLTHSRAVQTAVFGEGGKRVITASRDGTAQLWKTASGVSLRTLDKHTGPLTAAAFSPNSKLVVTASEDGTARIWDVANGRSEYTLGGHAGRGRHRRVQPGRKARRHREPRRNGPHLGRSGRRRPADARGTALPLTSASFSPDGRLVVTGARTGGADLASRAPQSPLVLHSGRARSRAPPSARTGRSSSPQTRTERRGSGASPAGEPAQILVGDGASVESASFSPDGTHVVTTSRDRYVRIWRGRKRRCGRGRSSTSARRSTAPSSARTASSSSAASDDGRARSGRPSIRGSRHILLQPPERSPMPSSALTGGSSSPRAATGTARIWGVGGRPATDAAGPRGPRAERRVQPGRQARRDREQGRHGPRLGRRQRLRGR